MNFTGNQVQQFYVMKGSLQTSSAPTTSNTVQLVSTAGAPYIVVKGAAGNTRSDIMTNIEYVKYTDAANLATKLKAVKVAAPSEILPKKYIVNIEVSQFQGMSDEEKYFNYGEVDGEEEMTASNFCKALALSLVANQSREVSKLFNIKLLTADSSVDVTNASTATSLSGSYTGVVIAAASQVDEWVLGTAQLQNVMFEVSAPDCTITDYTATYNQSVADGYKVADLEWFCMGNRGDIYRQVGYPNYINTKYLIDPTATYDLIDVHYSYVGSNESVQKSEKTITIAVLNSNATEGKKLAKGIAAAGGLSTYDVVGSNGAVTATTTA